MEGLQQGGFDGQVLQPFPGKALAYKQEARHPKASVSREFRKGSRERGGWG
jgi:hypothetical protein